MLLRPRHKGPLPQQDRHSRLGVSLVESAALISIAGILVAAFAPTFVRQLRMSKIAEAVEQLESHYQGTAAYYAAERQDEGGRSVRGCLPPSLGPWPATPSVEPQEVDFDAPETPAAASWQALGQHGVQRLRYSYQVEVSQPGCGPRIEPASPAVVFRASGDLDGDGQFSTLERAAVISSDQRSLDAVGPLHIRQRVE